MSTATSNKDAIGAAIGRMPSGVYIITCRSRTEKVGMLASWVMQGGFEPPMITVALNPERELFKLVKEIKRFSVNILSVDNTTLMKVFSKFTPNQFEVVPCVGSDYGITLNEAVAVLHCELTNDYAMGDHHLLVAEIKAAEELNLGTAPFVHLRKSGFNY